MTRPPFIDAHLHLWNRDRLRYPWLDEADKAPLAASYAAADHRAAAAAWGLVGAVHVDAGAHPDDGERETDWLNDVADAHGLPTVIVARVALDAILLAGRYTLLEQDALTSLFPACERAGTSIVIGGPYNSGILATGTRRRGTIHYDYGPAPDHILARVRGIEAVADRHGVRLPAAALAFVLAHPLVASVIPGIGSASRVAQTIDLHRDAIAPAFWEELRHEGLLPAAAPVSVAEVTA